MHQRFGGLTAVLVPAVVRACAEIVFEPCEGLSESAAEELGCCYTVWRLQFNQAIEIHELCDFSFFKFLLQRFSRGLSIFLTCRCLFSTYAAEC